MTIYVDKNDDRCCSYECQNLTWKQSCGQELDWVVCKLYGTLDRKNANTGYMQPIRDDKCIMLDMYNSNPYSLYDYKNVIGEEYGY